MEINTTQSICHPENDNTYDCLAVAYGLLLYCFEGMDQPNEAYLSDVRIHPNSSPIVIQREGLLGNVMEIKAQGTVKNTINWKDVLYCTLSPTNPMPQDLELMSIPYYVWANRGLGSMRVWTPRI